MDCRSPGEVRSNMKSMGYSREIRAMQGQRGAALIVGLIMLLLLTLIGVAGMRDTLLQEKMAGNMRDRELAFQAAESAMREAEALVKPTVTKPTFTVVGTGACTGGKCARTSGTGSQQLTNLYRTNTGGAAVDETTYWQIYDTGWTGNNSVQYAGTALPNVAAQPRYVIEELPAAMSKVAGTLNNNASCTRATSSGGTAPCATVTDYRITTRGVGSTSDAVVILQSVYRRVD